MEYLMTYGWAILIIAVVLAALFSLNVFNAGAQLGTSCIGQPGYSCSAPIISQGGTFSFTLGYAPGFTSYNVLLSCISSSNSATPGNGQVFNALTASGTAATGAVGSGTTFAGAAGSVSSGTTLSVTGLQCYPSTGNPNSPNFLSPIGTGFTGVIWAEYASSIGGTAQYAKIATVSVKSSS
jgi:hypothetical protein